MQKASNPKERTGDTVHLQITGLAWSKYMYYCTKTHCLCLLYYNPTMLHWPSVLNVSNDCKAKQRSKVSTQDITKALHWVTFILTAFKIQKFKNKKTLKRESVTVKNRFYIYDGNLSCSQTHKLCLECQRRRWILHADKTVSEWIRLGWTEFRVAQIRGKKSRPRRSIVIRRRSVSSPSLAGR